MMILNAVQKKKIKNKKYFQGTLRFSKKNNYVLFVEIKQY